MDRKNLHIAIAYLFHIVLIVMSFAMMENYYNTLQISFIILGCLYLIYWNICIKKSHIPWKVYSHFCVGVVIQILLNICEIIPKDGGWFSGLGQFFYMVFVIVHALMIGLTNLISHFMDKKFR